MVERSAEQMTLREKFIEAERLTRELIEHLEHGFVPKARDLARLIRPIADDPERDSAVQDITVRNNVAELLASEEFTGQVYDKLTTYCDSINRDVSRIVTEG